MTSNDTSSRYSLFSTPQATRKSSSCVRRSLSQINLKEPNETLFTTLMNDPLKKALLMQLLASHKNDDKNFLELQRKKDKANKIKPTNFSPLSVHRKKLLAAHEAAAYGSPTKKAYIRAPLPFNKLLSGVVAYVQIISQGQDRSTGVKALLKTMGGRVSEFICKGITHAIIKDVPYETYRRANLVKAQLVSVLWLEAVRKNHCRVPENHYPALGPQANTSNVSLLCEELQEEYAEVVKDELECSGNLQKKIKQNLSAHFGDDVINSSLSSDSASTSSGIGSIFQHSKRKNTLNISTSSNNDENVQFNAASESIESLRISSSSSKRRTINAFSSLRNSTQSNKSKNESDDKPITASESIESLRISSSSSKRRTSSASSLRNSTQSNKSKNEGVKITTSESIESLRISLTSSKGKTTSSASEPIESLRLSSNTSNRRSTRQSKALSALETSPEKGINKKSDGVSEPIGSLRISSSSSKQKTPESALSSLRISLSDSSKETNSFESSRRSSDRLKNKSFHSNKKNDSSDNVIVSPEIPPQKNIYVHVTERKKRRQTRLNFSSSDENDSENQSLKKTKIVKNITKRSQRQCNFSLSDNSCDDSNENEQMTKQLEISSILMTPNAKKLFDNLQNTPLSNGSIKKIDQKVNNDLDANDSFEDDPDKSQNEDKSKKVIRKRKLYNENDVFISQSINNDSTNKITTPKSKNLPENVTKQDNVFKTPGKPVKTKIVSEKKLIQKTNSSQGVRSSQRIRRSTLDFLPKESFRTPRQCNTPVKPKKLTSIVCSRFHTKESLKFEQIVNKLGNFIIERDVTERTSHLVLAEPRRTVNVLRAMARGCWILKSEWLFKSLKEGEWLPEENYEMTEFSQAVEKSRQERQAFGGNYTMDLFGDCGKIYISKTSTPHCSDLQDLVKICNGKITTILRNADIIVGEYVDGTVKCVKENWIMDCIQFYKIQSFKSYLLIPAS